MGDFFEQKNVGMDVTEFRNMLDLAVSDIRQLDEDRQKTWEESDELKAATTSLETMFAGLPPLSFLEALNSYYTGIKQKLLLDEIPSLLREAGLEAATTTDGTKVSIHLDVNVTPVTKDGLYTWLKDHGYEDHVKTVLAFGKGEFSEDIRTVLADIGASYEAKEDVHHQTIKKIFRTLVEEGGELPPESVAKVKLFERAKV